LTVLFIYCFAYSINQSPEEDIRQTKWWTSDWLLLKIDKILN